MLTEESVGDTGRSHPPSEDEVVSGEVGPYIVESVAVLVWFSRLVDG